MMLSVAFFGKKGNDGAGGGGGGGSILIKNVTSIPSTININSIGGDGGNHNLTYLFGQTPEGSGPGGSGTGGFISFSTGTPQTNVFAGISGISNSAHLTEFPPNGATAGDVGYLITNSNIPIDILINDTTICSSSSVTLSANLIGSSSSSLTWYDQAFGGNAIHVGNIFTTPILNSTTSFYVGVCPGLFRKKVTVYIGSPPVISGNATISNSSCGNPGAITGLIVSGGVNPYNYSWNGQNSPTIDLINASPGTYTITITDSVGCSSNSGPYTIQGFAGPVVDTTSAIISPQLCNGTNGSITGITASGANLSYLWTNGAGNNLSATNLNAGSYNLTISDTNGCTYVTGPYIINYIAGPIADTSLLTISNSNCDKSNGSISGITATGSSITYYWLPGGYTTPNIDSLLPGSYTLTIIDSNSCSINLGPYLISSYSGPKIDTTQLSIIDVNCFNPFGAISGISIIGNYSQFDWSDPNLTSLNPSGLSSSNYNLVVSDSVGCKDSVILTINSFPPPLLDSTNIIVIQPTCIEDGSISMLNIN